MKQILIYILLFLSLPAAAQFTPRTNINGYPRFLNAHQDTLGVLRNVGGGTGSWGRVRVADIDTAALRSWFGPGGSDGNNLTTGISFSNQRLTLTRSGLSSLTADIDTVFLSTVRAVRDSLVTIRTLLNGKQNTGNYSLVGHSHVIGDVTGLSATLSTFLTSETDPTVSAWAKAPVKPSYTYAEISGTPTTWPWAALTGVPSTFTPSAHNHVIADVTGLQTALDGKGDVFTSGAYANPSWITSLAWGKLTGVPATFTPSTHGHAITDVTGLQTALDGKVNTSRTVNGQALTSDITLTASDVGLGNVPNVNATNRANHTGTQPWSTITGTPTSLSGYGITDVSVVGAFSIASTVTISSGTASTVPAGTFRVDIDPASALPTYTLTLPASPADGQRVMVRAGRLVAAGQTVVTSFTVSPNSGHSLYRSITPTALAGGDVMEFEFQSSTNTWTRIK